MSDLLRDFNQPLDVPHHDAPERHIIGRTLLAPQVVKAGATSTVGISDAPAREDHVHPFQSQVGQAIYRNATQSIPNNTIPLTIVTFTTSLFGSGFWDGGNKLIVPAGQAGLYRIHGYLQYAGNTNNPGVFVTLNGSVIARTLDAIAAGGSHSMECNIEWPLSVGDFLELRAYQSSGVAVNLSTSTPSSTDPYGPYLSCFKIAS